MSEQSDVRAERVRYMGEQALALRRMTVEPSHVSFGSGCVH